MIDLPATIPPPPEAMGVGCAGGDDRRKALGRDRSRRFYSRNREALQRKAYFRCLEKGLIRTVRPSTALKYGIGREPRAEASL